jgi:hypothetical protein
MRRFIKWLMDDPIQKDQFTELRRSATSIANAMDNLSGQDKNRLMVQYPELWASISRMDAIIMLGREERDAEG